MKKEKSQQEQFAPRKKPRLKAAPRIGQIYWCQYPEDAQAPEMYKERPVIIISKKNTLYGSVLVVPCSSQPNLPNSSKNRFKIKKTFGEHNNYVVCDQITSVAVSRLRLDKKGIVKIDQDDFNKIVESIYVILPDRG